MPAQPPKIRSLIEQLIAEPSVSSINPQWDQTNRGMVSLLGGWLEDLGFTVEILPVPGHAQKYNLVANAGGSPTRESEELL